MGNAITNKRHSVNDRLKMSNGLTEVFLHVLVLNGSALAASDGEKDLITWLARNNQEVVGRGTVGFDLREMPWSENFHQEKDFLLQTINAARSRCLWEKLNYEPRADSVTWSLNEFQKMIESFQKQDVDPASLMEWNKFKPAEYRKCPLHGVYLFSWDFDNKTFDYRSCLICSFNWPQRSKIASIFHDSINDCRLR